MSQSPRRVHKIVPWLPGDVDDQVLLLMALGWIVLPILYFAWASATGHPFIPGAAAFAEGLWLIVVLLWIAAWDLGAWWARSASLDMPIETVLIPPSWPKPVRQFLKRLLDDDLPLVALIGGLFIGHIYWH